MTWYGAGCQSAIQPIGIQERAAIAMAKSSLKPIFTCQSCGHQSSKWLGRCPQCGQWDSLVEEVGRLQDRSGPLRGIAVPKTEPIPITAVPLDEMGRLSTHIRELDRVLGGGLVAGSLVLIGGDPGIGKSTLMLQALSHMAGPQCKVLYVSGEESVQQLRLRSERLDALAEQLLVVSDIDMDRILKMVAEHKPNVLVIDSIQTMYCSDFSAGQCRTGARFGHAFDAQCQKERYTDLFGGACHQGRRHRRPQAAGTYGRHGALF